MDQNADMAAQMAQLQAMQEMNRGVGVGMLIVSLTAAVLTAVCGWRLFTKAGQPGWAVLIPFYNVIVFLRIAGKPWWWLLPLMIPFVGFVMSVFVMIALAERFGKGTGFAIGLVLLGFIFFPILAFGSARYQGAPAAVS
jgi:hypothetical protein